MKTFACYFKVKNAFKDWRKLNLMKILRLTGVFPPLCWFSVLFFPASPVERLSWPTRTKFRVTWHSSIWWLTERKVISCVVFVAHQVFRHSPHSRTCRNSVKLLIPAWFQSTLCLIFTNNPRGSSKSRTTHDGKIWKALFADLNALFKPASSVLELRCVVWPTKSQSLLDTLLSLPHRRCMRCSCSSD